MPKFLVLRDAFKPAGDAPFVAGRVWVRDVDSGYITVYAGMQFSVELSEAKEQLAYGRNNNFSEDDIWEYLETHGGNGYTDLRAGPTEESGASAEEVGLEELRSL